MTATQTVIRVNLRFGPRTDPKLLKALTEVKPADRAGWVRAWVTEGWRRYHGEEGTGPSPRRSSLPSPPSEDVSGAQNVGPAASQASQVNSLEDGIAAFLGQRIV